MELDFTILSIDEEKGFCELAYKGKEYIVEHTPIFNEIMISEKNGIKGEPKKVMPSKDYMSYHEYFYSQEFKEGFVSDRLCNILADAGFVYTYGYESGYMICYDTYKIIKNAYAAYYKDEMYHYISTDEMGDLIEHEVFDNEASFWEYVESTDYMQNVLSMTDHTYQQQCIGGKYVSEHRTKEDKDYNNMRKKLIKSLIDKQVPHSRPVMENVVGKPSRELKDAVWLAVHEWSDQAYPYQFVCVACNKKIDLRTGGGRYGHLGDFKCPFCNKEYYATNDDAPWCNAYIYVRNSDGDSTLLFELETIDKQD